MNRAELEHVIRAAADITGDEIVVIGSQAILGQFPSAPATMLRSMEADLYPKNDPDRAIEIDGAIGDGSRFHEMYGYYAHGVGPETPQAPVGWEGRMLEIQIPPMLPGVTEALMADLVDAGRLRRGIDPMPEKYREQTGQRLEGAVTRIERRQANSMV